MSSLISKEKAAENVEQQLATALLVSEMNCNAHTDSEQCGSILGRIGLLCNHFVSIELIETSQAEQGHTRVPSSPSFNWTQSIQQSSNLLDIFY